jgi:hypothetical protein
MLPRVSDYFDGAAVSKAAADLEALASSSRARTLRGFEAAVGEHVRVLDDGLLPAAMVAIADDLYRSANSIDRWNADIERYLASTASVFWRLVSERGLVMRYVVDNSFESLERPAELFPVWFQACGIVYACPQVVAGELRDRDGAQEVGLAEYMAEARHVVEQVVLRCQAERRSYVLLDLDGDERTFALALADRDRPGVLTVMRAEAPEPGSAVDVSPSAPLSVAL